MTNRFRLGLGLWLLVLVFSAQSLVAKEWCDLDSEENEVCKILIDDLSPTQFAVGMREVREKKQRFEGMDEDALKTYLQKKKHLVPVVIAPNGNFYFTDHHHLTRALWDADTAETWPDKRVYAEIQKNYGNKTMAEFWAKMKEKAWVYLKDEHGTAQPISALKTKAHHVKMLKDDPYRSLAGEVRDKEGFDKTYGEFAEFQWADHFRWDKAKQRPRVVIEPGEAGWKKALAQAMKEAKSPAAKHLPGYNGPK